ncbi:DNA polymerase III subunit delta' [Cumulibacter manganitolerans]|uniref:DNA polymerase III subunit delta' n=1 Tax=Cumulibacter manganitolerans TaxID=1884992 RepID=UPI001E5B6A78|nr:DNA polymerase III subunit delta' [Cumulibacter manganitolerans]
MSDIAASPPVFGQLVGQQHAVDVLTRAASAAADIVERTGPGTSMTHAWLFVGPPGSGRSTAARAFAQALQCPHGGCGTCTACHTVKVGTHADVHVVTPEGLSISVREMREIVRVSAFQPSGGRWQIVIIEDADRLTEGASNALLKAIEEPSPHTVFLLCAPTTHPDDVSVTVRSRCRVVSLRTPPVDAVAQVLRSRDGIDAEMALWAARAAQGHIGRAKRLATDEVARSRRQTVLSLPLRLTSMAGCLQAAEQLVESAEAEAKAISESLDEPEREALSQSLGAGGTGKGAGTAGRGMAGQLKELERRQKTRATRVQRDALDRALVDLTGFYRDVLLIQVGSQVELSHADHREQASEVAELVSQDWILRALDAIVATRQTLEENVKPRVALAALMTSLRLPAR